MANAPPRDDELDELFDNALEEFTAPTQKPKTATAPVSVPVPETPSTTAPATASTTQNTGSTSAKQESGFEEEFMRQLTQSMNDMLKDASSGEAADDDEMRKMLDQMLKNMGSLQADLDPRQQDQPSKSTTTEQKTANGPQKPQEPQSFQDKINATMAKLKDSATQADEESSNTYNGSDLPEDELMRQLDTLADDVVGQLMSKELLQQPLEQLNDAYPAYLEKNKATLPEKDFQRYQQQHAYVKQILELFAKTKGDSLGNDPQIIELMQKMQDCGQPPNELLKLLAPDMELDEKGDVKVPEVPNCTIA
ncbi:Peroxisome chaperone and import receptor [Coemansia guatemalensis]|uniref:Peroxisome chaperone and import receptor n=1 Tax=Coemansia guatemalensis TaxID=2761395 RepID=A0A9W8HY85_9FUNG|nr:Peroxisome chaperone and import receptor [Coemansia guatemalensis]